MLSASPDCGLAGLCPHAMQVEGAEISNGKAKWEVEQLTEAMEELTEISGPPIGTLSQQMAKGARL